MGVREVSLRKWKLNRDLTGKKDRAIYMNVRTAEFPRREECKRQEWAWHSLGKLRGWTRWIKWSKGFVVGAEVWEVGRGQITKGFIVYCKEFGVYFRCIEKHGRFKAGSDIYIYIFIFIFLRRFLWLLYRQRVLGGRRVCNETPIKSL